MVEIELSLIDHGGETGRCIASLLEQLEKRERIRVRLQLLSRETVWTELVKYALYSHGPQVSEIGTTWLSNLIAMNAVRPFQPEEMEAWDGGEKMWVESMAQTGIRLGERQVWAIPWLADVRVIYYRRDWVEAAGLDAAEIFRSYDTFEAALERLQAAGRRPWIMPTRQTTMTVHNTACFIWAAGGDLVTADGRRTLFTMPEALAGMRRYFGLHRFLAPAFRNITDAESDNAFAHGQAAMTISGPWIRLSGPRWGLQEVIVNLGAASVAGGPAYVGGSNFIIWNHCREVEAAQLVVRELCSRNAQAALAPLVGMLPVRLDVWNESPFVDDPVYSQLGHVLRSGRSLPPIPLLGLVEDKLSVALGQLWEDVLAQPEGDLNSIITARLEPLARRLDVTLAGRK